MRDPKRIDVFCDELKEIWGKLPDWRFFQLVGNYMRYRGSDCFYVEDDDAIVGLREYVEKEMEIYGD